MKLSDYLSDILPLTRENFLKLKQNSWQDFNAFKEFCNRMNKEGGYGALR